MMLKRETLLLGLLALVVSGTTLAQRGQQNFARGQLFPAQLIQQHRTELALTREQSVAIRDIIGELQGKVSALQFEMSGLVVELQAQLEGDDVDEEAFAATAHELMLIENTVKVEQLRMLVRIRNVLTAEQLAYLRSLE